LARSAVSAPADFPSSARSAGAAPEDCPSPASTSATGVPTLTVCPSCTRIFVTVPAAGDGTSVSTLSVEISNSGSSWAIASPSFFSHFRIVPSTTVSPSCGMLIVVIGPPGSPG
jgi:hypothetical protein